MPKASDYALKEMNRGRASPLVHLQDAHQPLVCLPNLLNGPHHIDELSRIACAHLHCAQRSLWCTPRAIDVNRHTDAFAWVWINKGFA